MTPSSSNKNVVLPDNSTGKQKPTRSRTSKSVCASSSDGLNIHMTVEPNSHEETESKVNFVVAFLHYGAAGLFFSISNKLSFLHHRKGPLSQREDSQIQILKLKKRKNLHTRRKLPNIQKEKESLCPRYVRMNVCMLCFTL